MNLVTTYSQISVYTDMEPFAGCLVAYKPHIQSQAESSSDSAPIDEEAEVKFGTVSSKAFIFSGPGHTEDRTGFIVYAFFNAASNNPTYQRNLDNCKLEREPLAMRAASLQEITKLRTSISLGEMSHPHLYTWLNWENLENLAKKHFADIAEK